MAVSELLVLILTLLPAYHTKPPRDSHLAAIVPLKCEDHARWCDKLGRKVTLMRCYRHGFRCCASCRRLALSIPGCPYGDRESWCSDIGALRPVMECYVSNYTCCETCHLYDGGLPGCGFGDRETRCQGIGVRFELSACYYMEDACCDTCHKLRRNIPGCPYGDRQPWCSMVKGECDEATRVTCCERCQQINPGQSSSRPTLSLATGLVTRMASQVYSTSLSTDITDHKTPQRPPIIPPPGAHLTAQSTARLASSTSATGPTSSSSSTYTQSTTESTTKSTVETTMIPTTQSTTMPTTQSTTIPTTQSIAKHSSAKTAKFPSATYRTSNDPHRYTTNARGLYREISTTCRPTVGSSTREEFDKSNENSAHFTPAAFTKSSFPSMTKSSSPPLPPWTSDVYPGISTEISRESRGSDDVTIPMSSYTVGSNPGGSSVTWKAVTSSSLEKPHPAQAQDVLEMQGIVGENNGMVLTSGGPVWWATVSASLICRPLT